MKYYLAKFNLNVYNKFDDIVSAVQSVETRLIASENEIEAQRKLLDHFKKIDNEKVWYTLNSINIYEQI
jgi:hypothetical protein